MLLHETQDRAQAKDQAEAQTIFRRPQESANGSDSSTPAISLGDLVRRFWRYTTLTWTLVLLEGACLVAFPPGDRLGGGRSARRKLRRAFFSSLCFVGFCW